MKLLTIVGARPQFVKLAPLVAPMEQRCQSVLVHTGQHYDQDMSDSFFEEFGLPIPNYCLNVGSGSHGEQTGQMMQRLEPILQQERPNWVIVFGDTNSTLAGALVAAKLGIPLAHVEAGLRSFNRSMPEEINRVVADHLSSLLFCPTATAVAHLAREGISKGVHLVGDIMVDAVRSSLEKECNFPVPKSPFLLLTLHRAETTEHPQQLKSLLELLDQQPEPVIFPCHPRTRKVLREISYEPAGAVRIGSPVGHRELLELARQARMVLTDSGGLQKEAYLVGTMCVTLRSETEWVETVDAGWNRVVGLDPKLVEEALKASPPSRPRPDLYGDGKTARHILDIILSGTAVVT